MKRVMMLAGLFWLLPMVLWAGEPIPELIDFEDNAVQAAPQPASAPKAYSMGAAEMKAANQAAAGILTSRMERDRSDDMRLLRESARAEVIVVTGSYDRVQEVLGVLELKHIVIPPHLLAKMNILPTQVLMINCPGHVPAEAIPRIRSFVERGGFLFTTDWALTNVVEKAFPKYVRWNRRTTGNEVIKVRVKKNVDLLQQVQLKGRHPRWWLEGSSYPIEVLDRKNVEVLIHSTELEKSHGHGAVAVRFRHGDGLVLHIISHFYLQQGKNVGSKEVASGETVLPDATLDVKDLTPKAKKALKKAKAGDVSSAYSMQQMTVNVLVDKRKHNEDLLKNRYDHEVTKETQMRGKAGGKTLGPAVKKGYSLEVLGRDDDWVKVRTLNGEEGWLPAADAMAK